MAAHPTALCKNEFVGGCDIIEELSGKGKIGRFLKSAYPDREFTPPPPPAEVQEVHRLKLQKSSRTSRKSHPRCRPPEERAKAALEITNAGQSYGAGKFLDSWDPETPMMLICTRAFAAGRRHNISLHRDFSRCTMFQMESTDGPKPSTAHSTY
ncbi:MAG: hypothetical protein Ct9H90mP9_2390 [Pseudomonadota bacterium]|nr:MAG: hypothetical protein Ct9H90mP9_2390 [Pseudomonadota bacterium]